MKIFFKCKPLFTLLVIVLLASVVFFYYISRPIDIIKEIETSRFVVIMPITQSDGGPPVYLATYNKSECGYGSFEPCYFFKYNEYESSNKHSVIGTYYVYDEGFYQNSLKFKDRNTIQFMTIKYFTSTSTDSYSVIYTKELDIQRGKITTVKEDKKYDYDEYY